MLKKIEEAIEELHHLVQLNASLQEKYDIGSTEWNQCESIDNRLYAVLALLSA